MASERDDLQHDGTRVFVLWLCWVVLTLFLVAAGVIWFV